MWQLKHFRVARVRARWVPIWLSKKCSTHLIPHMLSMYNESLELGVLPQSLSEASGSEFRALSKPRPLERLHVDPNMDTELDSVFVKPASKNILSRPPHEHFPLCPRTVCFRWNRLQELIWDAGGESERTPTRWSYFDRKSERPSGEKPVVLPRTTKPY